MKNILLFTILMAFAITYGQEQNEPTQKIQLYKVWLKLEGERVKGFLYAVDEKGVTISKTKKIDFESLKFIPAEKINLLKIRKRGSIAKSSLLGGFGGVIVGYGLGLAAGDDNSGWFSFSKEEKGSILGILLAFPSGIIGAIIGTSKKKLLIDYKSENLIKQLGLIKTYTIEYQLFNKL